MLHENVTVKKTIYEVERELKQYYIEKDKTNNSFLIKFYENLLLGKNNNLHSRDLIVEALFNKEN